MMWGRRGRGGCNERGKLKLKGQWFEGRWEWGPFGGRGFASVQLAGARLGWGRSGRGACNVKG